MVASIKDDLIGRVASRYPDDGAWLAVVHNSERVDGCRCPTCGKSWPPSHVTCPEDGALLATRTGERIHLAETRILSGGGEAREPHEVHVASLSGSAAQEAFGFDTSIDVDPDRDSDTGTNQFDPFGSDIRTYLAHRPRFDEPARLPGTKSSDPPTSFVRRLESHIELPPGSMVGDDYEIEHRLGAGAMGEVYAARHIKLGKRVAIKAISPRLSEDAAAVERFAQEAKTLAQMHHPGLVDVLGFGELADGRAYFVMEFLSGSTLFDRLQRGRFDRAEALDVFGQAARALEAAHTHGVVHRDLKPENIFLADITNEPRPIVRLLDFGLARLEVEVDRRAERTQSGVVIGTAMYLSPEQARGPDVDGRTDIYALGCVGYELFLGHHPFEDARTVAALIAAHMHDVPPMPRTIDSSISPELDLLLFAMLAKDPSHRPTLPQIRSVIEGTRTAASAAPHPGAAVRAATVSSPSRSINRGAIAFAVIVLAVGIAIGAALRGSGSGAEQPAPTAHTNMVDAGRPASMSSTASPLDANAAPPPIDAGSVRPRIVAHPRTPIVTDAPSDAGPPRVSEPRSLDAGVVLDAEPPVDAEPTRIVQPAVPTRGYLQILAPQGAQILVDGTPPVGSLSRLSLAPGKHRIQFSIGANKDSFTVVIEAGQVVTLDKRALYQASPGSDDRNRTVNPFARKTAPR